MSYNIDTWRTKELESLRIPKDTLLGFVENSWGDKLKVVLLEDNKVEVDGFCEGFDMRGMLDDDYVVITFIEYWGEGSGRAYKSFKDLLSKSSGKLVASQVWEGGDSITRLRVDNGQIKEENVEI